MKYELVSNCCASDFDPLGYEKEEGVFQERCLKCGKLCEPLNLHEGVIKNIRACLEMESKKMEDVYVLPKMAQDYINHKGVTFLGNN